MNKGHPPRERQDTVFIDKRSLFRGYFVLFYQGRVIEVWPLFTGRFILWRWSLYIGLTVFDSDVLKYWRKKRNHSSRFSSSLLLVSIIKVDIKVISFNLYLTSLCIYYKLGNWELNITSAFEMENININCLL